MAQTQSLAELRAEYHGARDAIKGITERAKFENRDLNGDEAKQVLNLRAKMERILNGKQSPISAMQELVRLDISDLLLQVLVFRPTGGLMAIFRNGTAKHWGNTEDASEAVVWPLSCIERLAAVHREETQKRVNDILNDNK